MMEESSVNIRSLFAMGQVKRKELDSMGEMAGSTYQDKLAATIAIFEQCQRLTDCLSLFSPNETQDDVSSGDLKYLLIDYYIAELLMRITTSDRSVILSQAREAFERYIARLDLYRLLSKSDKELYEKYQDNRGDFSVLPSSDTVVRRDTKIARFRQETEMKRKLELLSIDPLGLENDDSLLRELNLANLDVCTHQTFHSLDFIAQELHLITQGPQSLSQNSNISKEDVRDRNRNSGNKYSEKLDVLPMSNTVGGMDPILGKEGKPLRPFTLLDNRQRKRDSVFKSGHNLPTMTIDEYLEEEKRRGGIVSRGGHQSNVMVEPDEDNIEQADLDTIKAREWDEFVEANPKGSGNTLSRG